MKEQGVMVDCVYCKYIKPELQNTTSCPLCHGVRPVFKAMRMMDSDSSGQEILYDILNMQFTENSEKMGQDLLQLLTKIDVYNFDFKSAIIRFLQNSDQSVE